MKNKELWIWLGLGALVLLSGGGLFVYARFKTKQDFYTILKPAAQQLQAETGIKPAISLAQAALESDYGKSQLSNQYHNYFGMKAPSVTNAKVVAYPQLALWAALGQKKATLPTKETIGGVKVPQVSDFMAFADDISCFRYWGELLSRLYPEAYKAAQQGDIVMFNKGLQDGIAGPYYTSVSDYTDLVAFNKDVIANVGAA